MASDNVVVALNFCSLIYTAGKCNNTWCPWTLVSAQEVMIGTRHVDVRKTSLQVVEPSYLKENNPGPPPAHFHRFQLSDS